ncbi:hypothetical protein KK141_11050 [Dyella sp. LX-66]|uniref:sensor histidine kinase n=1 Tax=unclassified Dyella TaxID=2634549 RepID=UPI001BE0CBC9|nr:MULTISPECIES: HAMP domain-containing sensor histidine kinase [unclassified Dyella]MBT2118938.1 hypothetical protein [Dyella sp. LX-1]MBT2140068.1 hypothetical protein [Dyella sp. LX-66]
MIAESIVEMLVFPYRVQQQSTGDLLFESEGSLFACPAYSSAAKDFFRSIKGEGWQRCPDGYAVYSRKFPGGDGKLLVVHGLKIHGLSTRQGREIGLTIKTDRSKVVEHVDAFIAAVTSTNEAVQNALTTSIHEIRSVNAALYHCSVELQSRLSNQGYVEALSRNATALSELLSARITLIDAMASDTLVSGIDRKPIAIYKKFDKMHRCYQAFSRAKRVDLKMSGDSRLEVAGDDLTELIPMLLIDNAVKYAPDKSTVAIEVVDRWQKISCLVRSWGPKLEKGEEDLIFLKGYRGEHARSADTSGSGIGLYFLRLLVGTHNGTVAVSQGEQRQTIKGRPYHETTFELEFPSWGA